MSSSATPTDGFFDLGECSHLSARRKTLMEDARGLAIMPQLGVELEIDGKRFFLPKNEALSFALEINRLAQDHEPDNDYHLVGLR